MLLRNRLLMVAALACAAGCVTTQPFTQSVRAAGYGPAELAEAPFLTEGEFELWTAVRGIGVSPRTPGRFVAAPDDTTIVVAVRATEQLELELTFGRTRGHADAYTLRAVNGQPLDKTITIEGIGYEYRACYLNVGWKCQNPIQPGTHNDTGVTLLVRLPRKPPSRPAS
jgi:hypothetical protein